MTFTVPTYETIPAGTYQVEFTNIVNDDDYGYGDTWRWVFQAFTGNGTSPLDGLSSRKWGPKTAKSPETKAHKWGHVLAAAKGVTIESPDQIPTLFGARATAVVTVSDDGRFNRIEELSAPTTTVPSLAPPAAVAEPVPNVPQTTEQPATGYQAPNEIPF